LAEPLEQGDPLWWVGLLHSALRTRRKIIQEYDDYYEGVHDLEYASVKYRGAFGNLFDGFADNWCDLVVDAPRERLHVQGFRLGEETEGDKEAWRIWQENGLDAGSHHGHTEALINGEASVLVWRDEETDRPTISVEHPAQMIVVYDEDDPRKRAAALKVWETAWGDEFATLYLPTEIFKYQSKRGQRRTGLSGTRWAERQVGSEDWPLPNPMGVVPVVPLVNRPRLLQEGQSEIKKVIPIQKAVNKLVTDMMVASEYGAFKQRWVTGIDIPIDPETGEPIEPFKIAVDRLLVGRPPETEDEETPADVKFGEFSETDLRNFVVGIEMLVQHIASQTRTPPHYFYLKGEFPSGESIKSAETGLVAKVHDKQRFFGESWEEVIRLAFRAIDDGRAEVTDSETIWGDPESRSESEHIDAVVKKKGLDVPVEQLWEDAGYTPQQIARFKAVRAGDDLLAAALSAGTDPEEDAQ
jgi:hypothetical protein